MSSFNGFFKGKKILITGHTGFKGSWLSHILLGLGANVSGYALQSEDSPNMFSILSLDRRMVNHFADIRDCQKIVDVIKNESPEIIFHLAAQPLVRKSYDDPLYTFGTNIMGTVNVLESIREAGGVKAAVMVTTDKVYENPGMGREFIETDPLGGHDPYSASKAGAELVIRSYIKSFFIPEQYGRKHETLIASARAGNVVGGGDWSKDRIIPDAVRSIYGNGEKIVLRNPDSVRPWQYVLEPLFGYMLLAKMLFNGQHELSGPWNFAPERQNSITVKELIIKTIKRAGKGEFEMKPGSGRPEVNTLLLNASKAKQNLRWKPVLDIDQTLEWTVDWYRKYYSKNDMIAFTDAQIENFMKICGYS